MRRLALVSVFLLIAGCSGSSKPAAVGSPSPSASSSEPTRPANEVDLYNNAFTPSRLAVKAGTTVIWKNFGSYPHNVVSDTKLFNSNPACKAGGMEPTAGTKCMQVGETFRYTFSKPGTYKYRCFIHSLENSDGTFAGMTGRVEVT